MIHEAWQMLVFDEARLRPYVDLLLQWIEILLCY